MCMNSWIKKADGRSYAEAGMWEGVGAVKHHARDDHVILHAQYFVGTAKLLW